MSANLVPIPRDELPKMVGKLVHLSWARQNGMVWRLERIVGDVIYLRTPSTGKPLTARAGEACYTRKNEPVDDNGERRSMNLRKLAMEERS